MFRIRKIYGATTTWIAIDDLMLSLGKNPNNWHARSVLEIELNSNTVKVYERASKPSLSTVSY